jgi:hypothetical protein
VNILAFLRRRRLTVGAALALIVLVALGMFAAARAQGQICRDVVNLTICGDELVQETSQGEFRLADNIKIGPRGGPMLLALDNREISFGGGSAPLRAEFTHVIQPGLLGATDIAVGSMRWINDPAGTALLQSHLVADPRDPGNLSKVLIGVMHVDVVNQRVFIPAPGSVPRDQAAGIERNSNMLFPFMDRAGLRAFFKDGGTIGEFKTIDAAFDLKTKKFNGALPLNLKLSASDENPTLRVTLRTTFDERGQFSGSVDGFKVRLGGLLAEAKGVVLRIGEFEAATVDILKSDNPDVPSLDPANPQLIFRFEKLKYKDGQFTIGGGAVGVVDFVFGDSFKLTKQTLGISTDSATKTAFFTINSTLVFGNVLQSATQVPVQVKIGATKVGGTTKPIIQATLTELTPKIGSLTLKLKNVSLLGDPQQNFFGLQAQTVDLQWPAHLGSKTAAGIQGLKLGVNRDKKLIFELAGGTVGLPEYDSGALRVSLQATISVLNNVVTFNAKGTATVKLQGNGSVAPTVDLFLRGGAGVADTCAPNASGCLKRFELKLSAFELGLAGFKLGLASPRGLEDGGFAADKATLSVPTGLGAVGGEVNGLQIHGDGTVQIAGGGIEIPPIQLGGFQFVGLKGFFAKNATGGYEFKASGTFPLPGIEPGAGKSGIAATVTIRTKADGGLQGLGVEVIFSATPGIPIGSTGMELTSIGGKFDVESGTVQIGVSMRASTTARLIGIPLASIDGNATLQLNPFRFTANAKLSVLVFSVAQASLGIGDGQGFSGGPGFNVSFSVNAVIVKGEAKLRLGNVTVNGVKKLRVAASASYRIGIDKGQFGFLLPPFEINLASIAFQGGTFTDRRSSPTRETAGLLGHIKVGPFGASLFVDLSKKLSQSGFVSIANADKLTLIEAARVRALAAQGVPGYTSYALSAAEARTLGLRAAPGAVVQQETIPIVITQTSTLVAGIHYTSGNPSIRLLLPNGGGELNAGNVCVMTDTNRCDNATRVLVRSADPVKGDELAFIVKGAAPGTYTLVIDNAPADYSKVSYQLNEAPTASITSTACAVGSIPGVTVRCNGVTGGGQVALAWSTADLDSPEAKVSIGYAKVQADGTVDPADMQLLAEGRLLGSGNLTWNLGEVPTGKYKLLVRVEDGSNAPVDAISPLLVEVTDQRAPAVPTGLVGKPLPGELLVNWNQNAERDLGGYEIGFGIVRVGVPDSATNFVYSRNMGPKEVVITGTQVVDAKLWGLKDDEQIFFGIRAYDQSNNFSGWSLLQRAKPWPLAPDAWTPTPGGEGATSTTVEVVFAMPLQAASLSGGLQVQRVNGAPVAGTLTLIRNLDGSQVIGLRFTPAAPLTDGVTYTAVLNGGVGGITALDGRQMPEDYRWSFSTRNQKLFLPRVAR